MTFGPPLWRLLALGAGALAAAATSLVVPALWALAAVLLALAARDLWGRPALVLTDSGFRYVTGLRREFARWEEVANVRVRQERHFLAFGRNVEVDLRDETLIVLSKMQLAADPDDVAQLLESARRQAVRSEPPS